MEYYCGSTFWDSNLTWHTESPDFTPCFQNTVLAWTPCGFLWILAAFELFGAFSSRARNIPWTHLNVYKCGISICLMILQLLELCYFVYHEIYDEGIIFPVDRYTPIIKIITFGLALTLDLQNKIHGIRSSGTMFIFWLLFVLCDVPSFRSVVWNPQAHSKFQHMVLNLVEVVSFSLLVAQFLLNCCADAAPEYQEISEIQERPCPEKGSSFPSRISFFWFESFSRKGYKKILGLNDLWDLNAEDSTKVLNPAFAAYWEIAQNKARQKSTDAFSTSSKNTGSIYFKHSPSKSGPRKPASILPVLFRVFGAFFLSAAFIKLLAGLIAFAPPQILNLLIGFVGGEEESWKGYLYALLLFVVSLLEFLFENAAFYRVFLVGLRVKSVVVSAIYNKSLRTSNAAREESTVGEVVNLMSFDVQRLVEISMRVNGLWHGPLQICLSLYFLWAILGPSALSGLVFMILLIPASAFLGAKIKKLQIKQMKYKDERIKLMNEILTGIKVLKFYAWEPSFEKIVFQIRQKEIKVLKKAAYLYAASMVIWTCAPFLVSLVTFGTYVLVDETHVLDAQKAFVSLTLFNVMRMPLMLLPQQIVAFIQAAVSLKRINKYLNAAEIDESSVTHQADTEGNAVVIQKGSFAWNSTTTVLKNINFRVKEGALVAVVGSVGCGKSSLLSAILGEVDRISGHVNRRGSCAYVSQQAWIQNTTLRNNILFGCPFDGTKYEKVIESCALKPDLEVLPAGDLTEIGERGINLSGGQKQRISLARAAYCYADLYLLDDVLSAVDSHVGKHLFEKVIGPNGLLKRKTRILVTHGVTYLPKMDQIIVIKDGEISETGTYKDLLAKKGEFADFLLQHIASSSSTDEEEDESILSDLEKVLGSKEEIRRRRSESESESQPRKRLTTTQQFTLSQVSQDGSEIIRKRRRGSGGNESNPPKSAPGKERLIEAETMERGKVKLSVLVYYVRAAGLAVFILTLFLRIAFQGFSVGSNFWLAAWSASGEGQNGTMKASERDMFLGVYAGLGLGQVIAILLSTIFMARGTLRASEYLHKQMFRRIIRAPMSFFDTTPLGRVVNRFSKDIDVADNALLDSLSLWMNACLNVAATLGVISFSTPIFIAVIVPIAVLYFLAQRFSAATIRQLRRLEAVTRSPVFSHFSETLAGVSVIRAFGAEDRFMQESDAKIDLNQACTFPTFVANRFLAVCLESCGCFIIFFAAIFSVISAGSLSPGLVGLSVSYAIQVTSAFTVLARLTSETESNFVSVERLKEYGEVVQEADWEIPDRKPPRTWPEAGEVVFQNYATRYREGLELVVHDMTCRIEPGERVGIVGRTGAGKSSLALALFRMIEASRGSIFIDGLDISKIGLHDLRRRITIIPQDPIIFAGTIRLNLDPFEEQTDEAIWRALELAHLKPFVSGLENQLDYKLTEGGDNLSQGQRQLVCLTRALLKKKKLFILDEATSGVDLETDELVQETIRSEFKDCTILTIAHRLNTITDYTRVMVLDKGIIREFDTPTNLLQDKKSIFYGMAKNDGLVP